MPEWGREVMFEIPWVTGIARAWPHIYIYWQYPGPTIERGARVLPSILLEPIRREVPTNDLKISFIVISSVYTKHPVESTPLFSRIPFWKQQSTSYRWKYASLSGLKVDLRKREFRLIIRCPRRRAALWKPQLLFGHLPNHKPYYAHLKGSCLYELNAAIIPFELFWFAINKQVPQIWHCLMRIPRSVRTIIVQVVHTAVKRFSTNCFANPRASVSDQSQELPTLIRRDMDNLKCVLRIIIEQCQMLTYLGSVK